MIIHWIILAALIVLVAHAIAIRRYQATLTAIGIFMTEILPRIRRIEGHENDLFVHLGLRPSMELNYLTADGITIFVKIAGPIGGFEIGASNVIERLNGKETERWEYDAFGPALLLTEHNLSWILKECREIRARRKSLRRGYYRGTFHVAGESLAPIDDERGFKRFWRRADRLRFAAFQLD